MMQLASNRHQLKVSKMKQDNQYTIQAASERAAAHRLRSTYERAISGYSGNHFVLFVLPIWLWLHYSTVPSQELPQSEQQRLAQPADAGAKTDARTYSGAESILDAEHPNWRDRQWRALISIPKLWRIPQQGMVHGRLRRDCQLFDVPVTGAYPGGAVGIFFGLACLPWLLTSFCHLR